MAAERPSFAAPFALVAVCCAAVVAWTSWLFSSPKRPTPESQ
jgi:hypothetical protein